ncbi:MAG: hypothetical protein IKJ98_06765 [Bacteroidales bacterium]|nr:hypothetical protein [Bacteroidales bacterium]MBR4498147.1 hypothetical protein [Bacteroidales bacterium]
MGKDLKTLLTNPFDNCKKNSLDDFKGNCLDIATKMLRNYCIQCGDKKYYFAEIEFYYYEKDKRDEKGKWDEKWNEKTYPRKNKNAGDFFFHYSGFDICFNSNFDKNSAKFGGILIRSLKDDKGNFITGPSVCSLEILNTCFELKTWPELKPCTNQNCKICKKPIKRYGIEDVDLCYYDEQIKNKLTNEFEDATWDYSQKKNGEVKGIKKIIRYYTPNTQDGQRSHTQKRRSRKP